MARQRPPAAPGRPRNVLENELAAQLQQAGTVVSGHGAKVSIVRVRIEVLELRVIERIEGFET
jgi:hypothetical protein